MSALATRRTPVVSARHATRAARYRAAAARAAAAPGTAPAEARPTARARITPLVLLLRWLTIGAGLLLVPSTHLQAGPMAVAVVLLLGNATLRTIVPLRVDASRRREALLVADLLVPLVAIALSGRWASPFVLTPLPTVMLAAYAWGLRQGLGTAVLASAAISLEQVVADEGHASLNTAVFATVALLAAAAVGGFARQVWLDADRRARRATDEVGRLEAANDLLRALQEVLRTMPSALDLPEVATAARRRVNDLFDYDAAVLLVREEPNGAWTTAFADGVPSQELADDHLPRLTARTRFTDDTLLEHHVHEPDATFLDGARSVLAAPLRARDRVVGLLVLESREDEAYTARDAALLADVAVTLAFAVDNAQHFVRIRTLGAEDERARIARDLHDRLAQSLAYVTLELDRLSSAPGAAAELAVLHEVTSSVLAELRETLYQLRVAVTAEQDLAALAGPYVERWAARTGIQAELHTRTGGRRLDPPVEQEVWRILQEALSNVEKHAGARKAWVEWRIQDGTAVLEVRDDGRGIGSDGIDRDRYGLIGIRERADAVGGTLVLDSEPGAGTRVRVEVEAR